MKEIVIIVCMFLLFNNSFSQNDSIIKYSWQIEGERDSCLIEKTVYYPKINKSILYSFEYCDENKNIDFIQLFLMER